MKLKPGNASSNEFLATRIDTTAHAAVAPVTLPVQQKAVSPLPLVGVVLGTIVLAGLIYLLARDHDGHYYRYPYYGEYYRYYYRPEYRPYAGGYPVSCSVVYAAAPITGFVLGVAVASGLEYLIVRDRDGRYERYPYYGPYRAHYYRADYRAYAGPYRDAPVHYGEWRGSAVPHRTDAAPAYTPIPQRPNDGYRAPAQHQRPNQPSDSRDGATTPRGNGNGNGNGGSRGRDTRQVCRSDSRGKPCSDGVHTNR